MAVWERLQKLRGREFQRLTQVYEENFPLGSVRITLADWIELQPWEKCDPDNLDECMNAMNELLRQLDVKMLSECEKPDRNFEVFVSLGGLKKEIERRYDNKSQHLVRDLKGVLAEEKKILGLVEESVPEEANMDSSGSGHVIDCGLQGLWSKMQDEKKVEVLRRIEEEQKAFNLIYTECLKNQVCLQQVTGMQMASLMVNLELRNCSLLQKIEDLSHLTQQFVELYEETRLEMESLAMTILSTELARWKTSQQLSGNGVMFDNNIDQIQKWCESFVDVLLENSRQLKQLAELSEYVIGACQALNVYLNSWISDLNVYLGNMMNKITEMLSLLVISTFVIEDQPPQVMKTNHIFSVTARLLLGPKLRSRMKPSLPQVKVTIINEIEAIELLNNSKPRCTYDTGTIDNNMAEMEYHEANGKVSVDQMRASFMKMKLKDIRRTEKKVKEAKETVTDEMFLLLFQSEFEVQNVQLQVWTFSLPVVVIVHGNQEAAAWATVTWSNAFAETGLACFRGAEKVSWPRMAEVLNAKFQDAVKGRGLTKDNLDFLAGKLSQNPQSPQREITKSQFCKGKLPDRDFTFWEWFYANMKFTEHHHLKPLWNDGLMLGFVGKKETEEMLKQRRSGTFLVRFSDSKPGSVTVAWVADTINGTRKISMVQPFNINDLNKRSLADSLKDLQNLLYLYPDVPKDQAFGAYYSKTVKKSLVTDGYVERDMEIKIRETEQ